MRKIVLLWVLAVLARSALGAGQIVVITWDAGGRFRHAGELAPAAVLEVCGPLEAGSSVAWSFKSGAALESNVHYHDGDRVIYPAKYPPLQKLDARLIVETKQEFCWMWRNRQATVVSLELELRR